MSKAVLVMDMPDSCMGCNFLYCNVESNVDSCQAMEVSKIVDLEKEDKPDWCPLRPLPEKLQEEYEDKVKTINGDWISVGSGIDSVAVGYNQCIDDILGGVK